MFEFEVDHARFQAADLPREILEKFAEGHDQISNVALLPWEEHCTECAMPQCYRTCDLYAPRKDGKCRRFVEGIGIVHGVPNILGYVVRISFKRWAQLMCYANTHMVMAGQARQVLHYQERLSSLAASIPDAKLSIKGRQGISSRLVRRAKQYLFTTGTFSKQHERPDFFVCEIYNPSETAVNLTLVLRSSDETFRLRPYQHLIVVQPGFQRLVIAYSEIAPHLPKGRDFTITIGPNIEAKEEEGLVLYFGLLSFVKADWKTPAVPSRDGLISRTSSSAKHVKVAIWDLDDTLWNGILVEDGPEKLRLREGVDRVIRELDRRGIVNSIVSKNDHAAAWERVKAFGLDEYFVFSKIGWGPKSSAVRATIEDFNVGADTVVFIDDSPFERTEVQSVNPAVRVIDATDCCGVLDLPEFNPPATEESSLRRQSYQNEERRKEFRAALPGAEYRDFLRQCQIRIRVIPASEKTIERAHELIQRTNQLNFSGNRYTREQVAQLVADASNSALCIFATDRFGDYGMVGFAIIREGTIPRMIDLMFSCRVQSKRVEHAFLLGMLARYREAGASRFEALYRQTSRNQPAGRVFEDLPFVCSEREGNLCLYGYDLSEPVPDERIITVEW